MKAILLFIFTELAKFFRHPMVQMNGKALLGCCAGRHWDGGVWAKGCEKLRAWHSLYNKAALTLKQSALTPEKSLDTVLRALWDHGSEALRMELLLPAHAGSLRHGQAPATEMLV